MKKRIYSHRHIQILALQRCSRAISLVVKNGIYLPEGFPPYGEDYPYGVELDIACNEIAYRLRRRLALLAEKEFDIVDRSMYENDSDYLNL